MDQKNFMQKLHIITAMFFTPGDDDSLMLEDLAFNFCIFLLLGNQTGATWV